MGKGAIIIALAALMATSALYLVQNEGSADRIDEEVDYQQQVLAREAAQSAFNVVAGKVKRDFENYRGSVTNQAYKDATYDYVATANADGSVSIVGTGRYGGHQHAINGVVDDSDARLLDALTLDGPREQFDIENISLISGMDTNLNGTDAEGPDVHAVLALDPAVKNAILNQIPQSKLIGVGDADNGEPQYGDVISGDPQISLPGLESTIRNFTGDLVSSYSSNQEFSTGTFGSFEQPEIMRVDGDLTLKGDFTGYGVAFVTGQFRMTDDARWSGLILVNNTVGQQHRLDTAARVRGVVVLRSSVDIFEAGVEAEAEGWGQTICHYPPGNTNMYHEITVGAPAVAAHEAHGDVAGSCPSGGLADVLASQGNGGGGSNKVSVCHYPPGNPANAHTITIGLPALQAHLDNHDDVEDPMDYVGPCDPDVETTNYDPISLNLYDNSAIVYSSAALKSLESLLPQIDLDSDNVTVRVLNEESTRLSTEEYSADQRYTDQQTVY